MCLLSETSGVSRSVFASALMLVLSRSDLKFGDFEIDIASSAC